MTKIKKIDNECQIHLKQMAEFFNESVQVSKQQLTTQYQATSMNTGQYCALQTSGSFLNTHLAARNLNMLSTMALSATHSPQLMDEEWHLLHNHEGCLKCCKFYIGHCANTCMVTLSGSGYKTCTLQDVLRAKTACRNPWPAPLPPITATVEAAQAPQPTELIAAIFLQNAHVTENTSAENDSDLSIASVMTQSYRWTTFLFLLHLLPFVLLSPLPLFPIWTNLCWLMIVDSCCTTMTHPRTPVLGPEGCTMTHGLTPWLTLVCARIL